MDTSSVFHRDMLDAKHREKFPADKPWLFETADHLQTFATEREACRAQRNYRSDNGFARWTGERVLEV